MKIGDMLYDPWNGNIGIIVSSNDNLVFDIYWNHTGLFYKKVYYGDIMDVWREAQKLKPR